MVIQIDNTDQLYLLQEALEDFLAKIDRRRHWRAFEQAELLAEQLEELAKSSQA